MRLADPNEKRGAQVAAFTSLLLIAQQVAGKAARDALFLSSFHSSRLPWAMAGGAAVSLLSAYWLSRLMVKHSPAVVMPVLFGASAGLFGFDWALAPYAPRAAALLVYLQTAVFGPMLISTFWSLINERFDPHTAKRAVSRIAGGGTLGGVVGGLAAWRASAFIQPVTVLLVLALVNVLAVVGTLVTSARRVPATPVVAADAAGAEVSPFVTLQTIPFLRNLALLVALGAAISALLDYTFGVQAAASFAKGQPLLSFFALFWLVVGVVSFLLQIALGRVMLEKLGLAGNIATLAGTIVLGGAFGLAVPGLASASVLRGAEAVHRNTLFRSAYELFYTPVPEASKRATKAMIDVGFDRLGTVLGSGIAVVVVHFLAHGQGPVLLVAVVVLALATLPIARQLHVGYVDALQQGLRDDTARLQDAAADDSAPRSSERASRTSSVGREGAPSPALAQRAPRLSAVYALASGDAEEIENALGRLEPGEPAVACAIALLGDPAQHENALRALRTSAPRITGQLVDALLDPDTELDVRRRIPRVLSACSTQRAADGLLLAIADEHFEVRYECGRALLDVTGANPQITISPVEITNAVRREVEDAQQLARAASSQVDPEMARERLEHVFTMLSLMLEREPLRMAFVALHHHDDKFRGTALEYLDTVLPSDIREVIWPYLGGAAPLAHPRSASQLLADLAGLAAPSDANRTSSSETPS